MRQQAKPPGRRKASRASYNGEPVRRTNQNELHRLQLVWALHCQSCTISVSRRQSRASRSDHRRVTRNSGRLSRSGRRGLSWNTVSEIWSESALMPRRSPRRACLSLLKPSTGDEVLDIISRRCWFSNGNIPFSLCLSSFPSVCRAVSFRLVYASKHSSRQISVYAPETPLAVKFSIGRITIRHLDI